MAKQTKAQKPIIEENAEQTTVMETVAEVKESIDNTIEDITPEVKENTNNKVIRIIQKRPSHYNLLMEDGTSKVVHKSLFDKVNMVVKSE
jgi:hypothetical protein